MKRFLMTTAIATVLGGAAFAQETTAEDPCKAGDATASAECTTAMNEDATGTDKAKAGSDTEMAEGSDTELKSDTDAEVAAGTGGADAELTTETELETEMAEGSDTELNAETETETEMAEGADSELNATDTELATDSELATDTEMNTDTEMATDTEMDSEEVKTTQVAEGEMVGDTSKEIAPEIAALTVGEIVGMNVESVNGDTIGEIDYVIDDGKGLAGVIGIGGFLGLGEYTVAVALSELQTIDEGAVLILDQSEEEMKALPEIDESKIEGLDNDIIIGEYASMKGSMTPGTEIEGVSTEGNDS